MRTLVLMVAILPTVVVGEWSYRTFLRPIDQPTAELRSIAAHIATLGLPGTFYSVRHGFRHSSVTALIAYRVDHHAVPFSLIHCPSESAAERRRLSGPNPELASRNRAVVLQFPFRSNEAGDTIAQVTRAFAAYRWPE